MFENKANQRLNNKLFIAIKVELLLQWNSSYIYIHQRKRRKNRKEKEKKINLLCLQNNFFFLLSSNHQLLSQSNQFLLGKCKVMSYVCLFFSLNILKTCHLSTTHILHDKHSCFFHHGFILSVVLQICCSEMFQNGLL